MMNDLILSLVGYVGGDILTLVLGRLGIINLAPVAKILLKEAIQFLMDKDGNVHVKEKKGFKTIVRAPNDEELSLIKRISNNDR